MQTTGDAFKKCGTCKKPIAFGQKYWVCSVSSCNRARFALTFCTVGCWDAHNPVMNHRSSWAEEKTAPPRPKDWDAFTQSNKGRAFGVLVAMVQEGQALGIFDPDLDPFMAATSVWSASHGVAQLLTHIPQFPALTPTETPLSASEFIAFHADLVFRGLQRPADTRQTDFNPGGQKQ